MAVGFLDEQRIIVGSHDGLGVLDAATGAVLDRSEDPSGDYAWFHEPPPTAFYEDGEGLHRVPVAGLWGGVLSSTTRDGWSCRMTPRGVELAGPNGSGFVVDDDEEPRACGFSPLGRVFVFATSPTLHVAVRTLT